MYTERILNNSDWIIYILLICIILLAVLKSKYSHRFETFTKLAFQITFFKLYNRDIDRKHPFTFISSFINILSCSLFLYIFFQYYKPEWKVEGIGWYIRIATFYSSFILGKLWIEQILGLLIKKDNEFSNYVYEKLLGRNMLSIFVLIWNILLLFVLGTTPATMLLACSSILVINALSVVSIYIRNHTQIFSSIFYIILYLCVLEIGPYLLIINALISN